MNTNQTTSFYLQLIERLSDECARLENECDVVRRRSVPESVLEKLRSAYYYHTVAAVELNDTIKLLEDSVER